ncbi:hypothetical protein F5Y12DRAFT_712484 [Xylaria sp. FL1777]|nr:hypothetical protein F5Y12DRAFT_712484 [Xylaria sp. FL1777]
MAPKYSLYSNFTITDALEEAGEPQDDAQFQAGEPPVTFFTQPPKDSAAVFSTLFGMRNFRFVDNPTYEREGKYWWAAEIQRVCDELRRNLPDVCRDIEAPQSYWDLYQYFDAYDIYYRGAQNLWNVINTLIFENQYVQEVVGKEQRMQTEQYMPLFKSLVAKFMRSRKIQMKLLRWDEENQPDILKALTIYDLRHCFVAYEKYPEHFLEAIRIIFREHYEALRKGGSLATRLDSTEDPSIEIEEQLSALQCYLDEASDDPFMDKFEISNRIINGIVIVDGTSQTAARKAGYRPSIHSAKNSKRYQAIQGNGADEQPPALDVPAKDVTLCHENGNGVHIAAGISVPQRCSSAPIIEGGLASIRGDPAPEKVRVYANDDHEVDKKLMGCEKPLDPSTTSADTQITTNIPQAEMYPPDSRFKQNLPIMNQPVPPICHHTSGPVSHHESAPSPHPVVPSSSTFVPDPLPPPEFSEGRGRGMSHGAFANQFPTYALSQQYMQGPLPTMQQMQYSGPVHMQPNGGGYTMNAPPPYIQTGMRQHYNAPPAFADGVGSSMEHKRNSGTQNRSNGKWQHVGSDDLHGPKVVFLRESIHSQESYNQRAGQWQGKEPDEPGRRTSTSSTSSGYRRFSNARPQQYNNHVPPRQPEPWISSTGSHPPTPAGLGHSSSRDWCVNAGKPYNRTTKFDPCPCTKCSDNDRTIYISRLRDGYLDDDGNIERLKQRFSKFGKVESVIPLKTYSNSARIKFTNPQSTVAAVHTEPQMHIDGMGDRPISVQFQLGSQFYTPRTSNNYASDSRNGYFTRNALQEQGAQIPKLPNTRLSNSNVYLQPIQYNTSSTKTSGGISDPIVPIGPYSDIKLNAAAECAMDVLDRAATQSGFGERDHERASYTGPGLGQTGTLQPLHGLASTAARDINGAASHHPIHSSQFDGTTEDLVRNITDLTQEIITSRQAGNPNNVVQLGNNAPQSEIPSGNGQSSLGQLPKNGDLAKLDEESGIDYGTVRIRPEKARYVAIPSDWQQSLAPLNSIQRPESQSLRIAAQNGKAPAANTTNQISLPLPSATESNPQVQITTGEITTGPQPKDENTMSSDNKYTNKHLDISAHAKRKASDTDRDEKSSDLVSPKKKVAKVIQPDGPLPESQGPQPNSGKKKKNGNKNRQSPVTELPAPETPPTTTPYETQTFQPVIAASQLPQYPQGTVQEAGLGASSPHGSKPICAKMPPTNQKTSYNGIEPFPTYRDGMSGSRRPIHGNRNNTTDLAPNLSISSNASTIIQDSSNGKLNGLNPGAHNFTPSPPRKSARNLTLMSDPLTSTSVPPANGINGGGGKDNTVPRVTRLENNGGRANAGTRQGGGQGRSKNGKGWKNGQKNVNTQTPTGSVPNANGPNSSGSRDATHTKKIQAPANQKVEVSKQGKTKSRAAPKKGAKASAQAENPTSKGPDGPSSSCSSSQPQPPKGRAPPAKPLLNSDDFPALPTRPIPVIPVIPLLPIPQAGGGAAAAVPNPWQKAGKSASALIAGREKAPPPPPSFPKDERKGG